MRKALIITAIVIVGLLAAVEFGVGGGGIIGDGAFPLTVEVTTDGDPPRRVYCQVHSSEAMAEWAARQPQLYDTIERVVTTEPFNGEPLEVRVEFSEYISPLLQRVTDYVQFTHLVVLAEWTDGRRVAKVVPIPDGRTTRTMRVELP